LRHQTAHSTAEQALVSKLLDTDEDYVPFTLQRSPRRPQSSKAHRAVSM
jgi:hypothetical protein